MRDLVLPFGDDVAGPEAAHLELHTLGVDAEDAEDTAGEQPDGTVGCAPGDEAVPDEQQGGFVDDVDPQVVEAAPAEHARYDGMAAGMARLAELDALRPGVDVTRATDIMWTVVSVETYEALVIARGWTPGEYEAWVLDMLRASLLPR